MKKILEIIINYSKESKLLDEHALNKIINILINEYNLQNINYQIKNDFNFSFDRVRLGFYMWNSKTLTIYYKRIINYIKKGYYSTTIYYQYKLSKFETYVYKNLFILETIFHEFEHALQHKDYESESESLEHKLISISTKNNYRIKDNCELYNLSILERLANINSREKILLMISSLNNEVNKLLDLLFRQLMMKRMENYDIYDSPTIKYLELLNGKRYESEYLKEQILSLYSYDDRIKYGLYLTKSELSDNLLLIKKRG